jgi:hypothetical protein
MLNGDELEPLAAVGGVLGLNDFAKRSAYEVDLHRGLERFSKFLMQS